MSSLENTDLRREGALPRQPVQALGGGLFYFSTLSCSWIATSLLLPDSSKLLAQAYAPQREEESQESPSPAHPYWVTQGLWERGRDLLCNLQVVKQGDRERHRPGHPGATSVCVWGERLGGMGERIGCKEEDRQEREIIT